MQESERAGSINRREFLRRALVGAAVTSTALIVGEQMFEEIARLAPRPLVLGPFVSTATYPEWASYDVAKPWRLTLELLEKASAQIYGVPVYEWRAMQTARRATKSERVLGVMEVSGDWTSISSGGILCRA